MRAAPPGTEAQDTREVAARGEAVPRLIRANTLWLALSRAFTGTGMQLVFALGPLASTGLLAAALVVPPALLVLGLPERALPRPVAVPSRGLELVDADGK